MLVVSKRRKRKWGGVRGGPGVLQLGNGEVFLSSTRVGYSAVWCSSSGGRKAFGCEHYFISALTVIEHRTRWPSSSGDEFGSGSGL